MKNQSEHSLQKTIIFILKINNIFAFQTDVMDGLKFFNHTDPFRYAFIKHHKNMGYIPGQPDIVCLLKGGRCVLLEIKNGKQGRQSPAQKEFEKKVKALDFEYYIIRNIKDLEKILPIKCNIK